MGENSVKISVISPCSRSLQYIKNLRHCFKNQTFKDFEHIVIYDGHPSSDIKEFIEEDLQIDDKLYFHIYEPPDRNFGTNLRNFGTMVANGDFVVFCDDDDVYSPRYLQNFVDAGLNFNSLICCKMNNYGTILPRFGINSFPRHGDIGTPQCIFPTCWFREPNDLKWRSVGGHDFHLVKDACDKFNPTIKLVNEVGIIVRGNMSKYYNV
jgi:glycosyltransferase involved in cell wall biosynthesis